MPVDEAFPRLSAESFDAVTFWHVLEHVESPHLHLREAIRVLRPGGLLIVNSPNMRSAIYKLVGRLWSWIYAPGHLQYFFLPSLAGWLVKEGLRIERVETWTEHPNLYFLLEEALLLRLRDILSHSGSPGIRIKGNQLSQYLASPRHQVEMQFRLRSLYRATPFLDRFLKARDLGHEFVVAVVRAGRAGQHADLGLLPQRHSLSWEAGNPPVPTGRNR